MTTLLQPKQDTYPYFCDGKPMSDNTEQYRWIVIIKENLEILFAAMEKVFIAGDLFWSPVEGQINSIKVAPDVMVVFGRPKSQRLSYVQWEEEDIPPQVAFEIRSPGNSKKEMDEKFKFYQKYGVKEYYLYDPHTFELDGWERKGNKLEPIMMMNDWVSPLLGIRFVMTTDGLEIYRPDGRKFLSSVELERERARVELERDEERQRADREQSLRYQAESQLEQKDSQLEQKDSLLEQAKAELARAAAQLEQEREQRRQLAERLSNLDPEQLKALGLDPDLLG